MRAVDLGVLADLVLPGDARYARGFVEEENIPFPVLVDDDAVAARAASVRRGSAWKILT